MLDFPWDGVWWGQGEVSDTGTGILVFQFFPFPSQPLCRISQVHGDTPGRARATQTMRAGEYPRFLRVLLLVRAGSFPLGRIHLPPYPRGQDERAPLCQVPFSLKSPSMLQKEPFWRWSSCSSPGGCSSSLGIRAAARIGPPWRLPVWLHELRHGLGMDQPGLRDTD